METVEVKRDVEERKLKKVKVSLMRNEKFALWSGILMVGKTSIDDNIPTACTNGRDEMYGRAFVRKMSEKMLAFVVLHEALHKAFRHLTVWRKLYEEDPALANQACDYVINLVITIIRGPTATTNHVIKQISKACLCDATNLMVALATT